MSTFASLVGIFSGLVTAASLFVALAMAFPSFREALANDARRWHYGVNWVQIAVECWSRTFITLFGRRYFSARSFITVPAYTVLVSVGLFSWWFVKLHFSEDAAGSFSFSMSPIVRQFLKDYYLGGGLIAAVLIDFVSIAVTKKALRVGANRGYLSWRFAIWMMISIGGAYTLLTLAVHFFRVLDTVTMYTIIAPSDFIPVVPYSLFPFGVEQWIGMVNPPTLIHATEKGFFTTYFMPEPILFYSAMAGQATLMLFLAAFALIHLLMRFRRVVIVSVDATGNQTIQSIATIIALVSAALTLLFGFLWLVLFVASGTSGG